MGGGDADGLADHHLIDAAPPIFRGCSLASSWECHRRLRRFRLRVASRLWLRRGLAVFLRDDAGNVVEVIFEQHLQLEQWLDAVFGRRAAPFGEGCGRGFDSLVDFVGLREWDLSQSFAVAGLTTSRHSCARESVHWPLM